MPAGQQTASVRLSPFSPTGSHNTGQDGRVNKCQYCSVCSHVCRVKKLKLTWCALLGWCPFRKEVTPPYPDLAGLFRFAALSHSYCRIENNEIERRMGDRYENLLNIETSC